jgi:hypothetical protein
MPRRNLADRRSDLPLRRSNKALAIISCNSIIVNINAMATPSQRVDCAQHFRSRDAVAALCGLEDNTCVSEVQTLPLRNERAKPVMRVRFVDALTRDTALHTLRTYPFLSVCEEGARGRTQPQPQQQHRGRRHLGPRPPLSGANTTPLGPRPAGQSRPPLPAGRRTPPPAAASSGAAPAVATQPPADRPSLPPSRAPSGSPPARTPNGPNASRSSPPPRHPHGRNSQEQHNAAQARASVAARATRQTRAALDRENDAALEAAHRAARRATASIDSNLRTAVQLLTRTPATPAAPQGPHTSTPNADTHMSEAVTAATLPASPVPVLSTYEAGADTGASAGGATTVRGVEHAVSGGGTTGAPYFGVTPISTRPRRSWLSRTLFPFTGGIFSKQGPRPRSPSGDEALSPPPANRMRLYTLTDIPPLPVGNTAPCQAPAAVSRPAHPMAAAGEH